MKPYDENLTNQMKKLLEPRLPSMLYMNEYIETGRTDEGEWGLFLFFTTKPHMFIMVKCNKKDDYKYIEYTAPSFTVKALLSEITSLVLEEFDFLHSRKQLDIIKGISQSLKMGLKEFDEPEIEKIVKKVIDDTDFTVAFTYDKYLKLTDDRFIEVFVNDFTKGNIS